MDKLCPSCNGIQLLKSKVNSTLVKATDTKFQNFIFDNEQILLSSNDKLSYLNDNASYMVSKGGVEPGSRNVRLYLDYDSAEGDELSFQQNVVNVIISYF